MQPGLHNTENPGDHAPGFLSFIAPGRLPGLLT